MPIPEAAGAHAGGDEPLLDSLFGRDGAADPLGQRADYADGLASVAIGLAANESMATGQVVDVSQFGLELSRAAARDLPGVVVDRPSEREDPGMSRHGAWHPRVLAEPA